MGSRDPGAVDRVLCAQPVGARGAPGAALEPAVSAGPRLDGAPAYEWAAGAGLDAVLDSDADMLTHLLPEGTSLQDVRAVVDRYDTLNMRELPVAIPMPEWNLWLPPIHPVDAFDTTAPAVLADHKGDDVGQPYFQLLYEAALADPTPGTLADIHLLKKWIGRDQNCCSNGGTSCTSWRSISGPVLTSLRLPMTT